jgi:hypothetical protein
MYLIQVMLPRFDKKGQPQPRELFQSTERELLDRFGGMMAYRRMTEGNWAADGDGAALDELVVCEVMTNELDREWWASYRHALAKRFLQKQLVVMSMMIDPL